MIGERVRRLVPAGLALRVPHLRKLARAVVRPNAELEEHPQQLSPAKLRELIRHDSEAVTRRLMDQLALDPPYGALLDTAYFEDQFGDTALYAFAIAALRFARGDLQGAHARLVAEVKRRPTAFAELCLARCVALGLGREAEAIGLYRQALTRHPRDLELTVNLATALFRTGDARAANEQLDTVREPLATWAREVSPEAEGLAAQLTGAITAGKKDWDTPLSEGYWETYWSSMNTHTRYQTGFGYIGQLYLDRLRGVLAGAKIDRVLDFGVMCAHPHAQLAREFPGTRFYGIDREAKTAEMNQRAYKEPNLEFVTGNIFDEVPARAGKAGGTLLFHARTATLLLPQVVKDLYATCANSGVEWIVLFENGSLGRHDLRFHKQGELPADAIAYRAIQFIHDYERYLRDAGYEIVSSERLTATLLLEARAALGDTHVFVVARKKQ
jgi:hypothetical protein